MAPVLIGCQTGGMLRAVGTSGWPLVGLATLVLIAWVGGLLAVNGVEEAGLRAWVIGTARSSLLLFLPTFSASALHRLWPGNATRWLLLQRRYLGVSFAVSHALHLLGILFYLRVSANSPDLLTLIFGSLGYAFIAAMTATSFDRSAAWLGPVAWRRLHTVGLYFLWAIFFNSYAGLALRTPSPRDSRGDCQQPCFSYQDETDRLRDKVSGPQSLGEPTGGAKRVLSPSAWDDNHSVIHS